MAESNENYMNYSGVGQIWTEAILDRGGAILDFWL